MKLPNNKILITGGSSGIGLALAAALKALNNYVIITGRERKKLESVATGYGFDYYRCDLASAKDLEALIAAVKDQHPDVNILINNAGLQYNYQLEEGVPYERIDYELEVNLGAVIKLCAAFVPLFLGSKESAIVNISSGLALSPKKSAPVYCASKAGVHMFTKGLRYQLEGTNVKVFEVLPPLVDTPMTEGSDKDKISPEQLASEFITGFEKNKYEMNIGKVKLLKMIHRISPVIADNLLKHN